MKQVDTRDHLSSLVGQIIFTLTGRPNRVLRIENDAVVVATQRSPQGQPVPIERVQNPIAAALGHDQDARSSEPLLLRVSDSARLLNVSRSTMDQPFTNGDVKVIRIGRAVRGAESSSRRWSTARSHAPARLLYRTSQWSTPPWWEQAPEPVAWLRHPSRQIAP